jgi:hypothetical protein
MQITIEVENGLTGDYCTNRDLLDGAKSLCEMVSLRKI